MTSTAALITSAETSKAHLVETLLTVVIQDCLANTAALKLAHVCLSTTLLKVRFKITVWQDINFFAALSRQSPPAEYRPTFTVLQIL